MKIAFGKCSGVVLAALGYLQTGSPAEEPKHTNVYSNQFDKVIELDMWSQTRAGKAPNGERFLGLFGGRDTLYQTLPKLPQHRFVRLRFDLLVLGYWESESKKHWPDTWALSVKGGQSLMFTSFSNKSQPLDPDLGGNVHDLPVHQSFPDELPFNVHDAGAGAAQGGPALGIKFPRAEIKVENSVYKIDLVFPHTGEDLTLQYTGNLSERVGDEAWGIDNMIIDTIDVATPLTDKQLAEVWKQIGGRDPVAANKAVWKVLAAGPEGAESINKKWRALTEVNPKVNEALRKQLVAIVKKLGSDKFVERQQANADLLKLGGKAVPLLEEEQAKTEDAELRGALSKAIGKLKKQLATSKRNNHLNLVGSRVAHINRIAQNHANGYKITSSTMDIIEFPNDPAGAAADGLVPRISNTQVVPRFTWHPHKGTEEWLQYEFPKPKTISQAEVFWFEPYDTQSLLPTSWSVVYRSKTGKWKPVETKDQYARTPDKFDRVSFKPVETDAVRLKVQLPKGETGGVYEFRVSDKPTTRKTR